MVNAAFGRVVLGSMLVTMVACAGRVARTDPNYTPAKLKGCAGYSRPSTSIGTGAKLIAVNVSFRIDAHGDVIPGSVRTSISGGGLSSYASTDKSGALAQAESDALSCRYDPAMRSGVAVESSGSTVFSYEAR